MPKFVHFCPSRAARSKSENNDMDDDTRPLAAAQLTSELKQLKDEKDLSRDAVYVPYCVVRFGRFDRFPESLPEWHVVPFSSGFLALPRAGTPLPTIDARFPHT